MPTWELDNGWRMAAERIVAPLALIKFTRGEDTQRARFDVDKRAFIDQIPSGVSAETRKELVETLVPLAAQAATGAAATGGLTVERGDGDDVDV
jgi:hypothetical protein